MSEVKAGRNEAKQNPREQGPAPLGTGAISSLPGTEGEMATKADHGESCYRSSSKLIGKVALITGADSGIGKAVAISHTREGADVVVLSYFNEEADAQDTAD